MLVGFTCSQVTYPLGHEKASTGLKRMVSLSPSKGCSSCLPCGDGGDQGKNLELACCGQAASVEVQQSFGQLAACKWMCGFLRCGLRTGGPRDTPASDWTRRWSLVAEVVASAFFIGDANVRSPPGRTTRLQGSSQRTVEGQPRSNQSAK